MTPYSTLKQNQSTVQTFAHGASSHWWQATAVVQVWSLMTRIREINSPGDNAEQSWFSWCDTVQATSQVQQPIHFAASAIINRFMITPFELKQQSARERVWSGLLNLATWIEVICSPQNNTGAPMKRRNFSPEFKPAVSASNIRRFVRLLSCMH